MKMLFGLIGGIFLMATPAFAKTDPPSCRTVKECVLWAQLNQEHLSDRMEEAIAGLHPEQIEASLSYQDQNKLLSQAVWRAGLVVLHWLTAGDDSLYRGAFTYEPLNQQLRKIPIQPRKLTAKETSAVEDLLSRPDVQEETLEIAKLLLQAHPSGNQPLLEILKKFPDSPGALTIAKDFVLNYPAVKDEQAREQFKQFSENVLWRQYQSKRSQAQTSFNTIIRIAKPFSEKIISKISLEIQKGPIAEKDLIILRKAIGDQAILRFDEWISISVGKNLEILQKNYFDGFDQEDFIFPKDSPSQLKIIERGIKIWDNISGLRVLVMSVFSRLPRENLYSKEIAQRYQNALQDQNHTLADGALGYFTNNHENDQTFDRIFNKALESKDLKTISRIVFLLGLDNREAWAQEYLCDILLKVSDDLWKDPEWQLILNQTGCFIQNGRNKYYGFNPEDRTNGPPCGTSIYEDERRRQAQAQRLSRDLAVFGRTVEAIPVEHFSPRLLSSSQAQKQAPDFLAARDKLLKDKQ